jgi:hypothetical protein
MSYSGFAYGEGNKFQWLRYSGRDHTQTAAIIATIASNATLAMISQSKLAKLKQVRALPKNQHPANLRANADNFGEPPPRRLGSRDTSMGYSRTNRGDQTVSISVAGRITAIEVHTLRYWEKEFADILHPVRTEGGQRRYRPEDIQTVFVIKRLLRDEMFSIAGAKRHLANQFRSVA